MKRCEIGYCVWILYNKRWGKTLIDNKLRSRNWWETRLNELINAPTVSAVCDWEPGIYDELGNPIPPPPRYESD